jgi:hypothetical protein
MKCLWHPLKKKGISLRERPPFEALGRSTSKGKEFVANPHGKLVAARIPKAPEKPVAEGAKAPRKPIVGKGKREAPKTHYVVVKASICVEDEQENNQVPSLKRSKKNNPEVGSGVGGVFASLMGAFEKTFTSNLVIHLGGPSCSPWR